MLLFAKEEDIINIKRKFEQKTGIEGAQTLLDIYNLLRLDLDFNFKLALEFKFSLDFHLVFNFGIEIPPFFTKKALYGMAVYGRDEYDPVVPPARYEPIRIVVFQGPNAWKEKAVWNLTYKYTMHDQYFFNQALIDASKRSAAYSEYFTRSPEYELTGKDLDFIGRATEFLYVAACWLDFNSFDLGRFWLGQVPLRLPKGETPLPPPLFDQALFDFNRFDTSETDFPYFDLDMFDSARFDTLLREDTIIWVSDPIMTAMRLDLAIFDAARFDYIPTPDGDILSFIASYIALHNLGEVMQRELDDYRVRSDPLVAAVIWTITSDRFGPNWVAHGVRMLRTGTRVAALLDDLNAPSRLGYQAFAREIRTRDITLGKATREQIIAKYVSLGLDERLLRRIAAMVESR